MLLKKAKKIADNCCLIADNCCSKKKMLLEHKKNLWKFAVIHGHSRSKTPARKCERDLVNLVDYAARVASELLIIAVKLLIIAVQRKKCSSSIKNNFWIIPGQLMVIPVQRKKMLLEHKKKLMSIPVQKNPAGHPQTQPKS